MLAQFLPSSCCDAGLQTPVGLLTPIVKDAHTKRLSDISADIKALAKKVCFSKPHCRAGRQFRLAAKRAGPLRGTCSTHYFDCAAHESFSNLAKHLDVKLVIACTVECNR